MRPKKIIVLGTMASDPYAGMAWMHMQIAGGFLRLGHDVTYLEATSAWPYDPVEGTRVNRSDYAVSYLQRVAEGFGLGERWAHRRSYADGVWLGPRADIADQLLESADAVFNVAGSTNLRSEGLVGAGNLILLVTDPVIFELGYANGDPDVIGMVHDHQASVNYGENIGTETSPVPALPNHRAATRQPILIDRWKPDRVARNVYTTVGNWKQDGPVLGFRGERYEWSKHLEFEKFIELPRRVEVVIELATNLGPPSTIDDGHGERVRALGVDADARNLLVANRWHVAPAQSFTEDPWTYQEYIESSRAEFTVARDLNVRLASGWFSERSACYLAAARPVITQDTGFGRVLPTGEGLLAFSTLSEAVEAIEAVESDYQRHSRAAREIAEECFRAEKVAARLLDDLGI